jgi:hypothetical protein
MMKIFLRPVTFLSFALHLSLSFLLLPAAVSVSGQLSSTDVNDLVTRHNFFRSQVSGASNMIALSWDPSIAKIAQAYADTCPSGHSRRSGYGENLAWSWPTGKIMDSLNNGWVGKEKPFYNYNLPSQCTGDFSKCGHYTQIIWAETSRFGCGARTGCKNMLGVAGSGVVFVCNFQSQGNIFTDSKTMIKAYKQGPACSACDKKKYPFCVNGLCSLTPPAAALSTNASTSESQDGDENEDLGFGIEESQDEEEEEDENTIVFLSIPKRHQKKTGGVERKLKVEERRLEKLLKKLEEKVEELEERWEDQ